MDPNNPIVIGLEAQSELKSHIIIIIHKPWFNQEFKNSWDVKSHLQDSPGQDRQHI